MRYLSYASFVCLQVGWIMCFLLLCSELRPLIVVNICPEDEIKCSHEREDDFCWYLFLEILFFLKYLYILKSFLYWFYKNFVVYKRHTNSKPLSLSCSSQTFIGRGTMAEYLCQWHSRCAQGKTDQVTSMSKITFLSVEYSSNKTGTFCQHWSGCTL